jgi:hypothetical protein
MRSYTRITAEQGRSQEERWCCFEMLQDLAVRGSARPMALVTTRRSITIWPQDGSSGYLVDDYASELVGRPLFQQRCCAGCVLCCAGWVLLITRTRTRLVLLEVNNENGAVWTAAKLLEGPTRLFDFMHFGYTRSRYELEFPVCESAWAP